MRDGCGFVLGLGVVSGQVEAACVTYRECFGCRHGECWRELRQRNRHTRRLSGTDPCMLLVCSVTGRNDDLGTRLSESHHTCCIRVYEVDCGVDR
jgi:hypothetical protein